MIQESEDLAALKRKHGADIKNKTLELRKPP